MKTQHQPKSDALATAERVWAGLSLLRVAIDEGDAPAGIRLRVNELVDDITRLIGALKSH